MIEVAIGFIQDLVDSAVVDTTLQAAGSLLDGGAAFLGLALLYRYSARSRHPDWRDVWPGTIVAATLLAIASWAFGVYMNVIGSSSVTGAASSVLVGLVLVYYMAQIVLFGAEIIKVLYERRNPPDAPDHPPDS
jgi:membrane protein